MQFTHMYKYHRIFNLGVAIQIRQEKMDKFNISCLYSSSYYSSHCQYQTQRVSLTLQFDVLAEYCIN
jgi:hypothetical protein